MVKCSDPSLNFSWVWDEKTVMYDQTVRVTGYNINIYRKYKAIPGIACGS